MVAMGMPVRGVRGRQSFRRASHDTEVDVVWFQSGKLASTKRHLPWLQRNRRQHTYYGNVIVSAAGNISTGCACIKTVSVQLLCKIQD